jgi:hypothetical protein
VLKEELKESLVKEDSQLNRKRLTGQEKLAQENGLEQLITIFQLFTKIVKPKQQIIKNSNVKQHD